MTTLLIFFQTNLSQSKPVAIIEILLLLSAATIIGWLIARLVWAGRINDLQVAITTRQAELDDCRRSKVVATPRVATPVAAFAGGLATSTIPDDLTIVEGIGPKIAELLNNESILTFGQLASTSPDRIKEILVAAGPRFQMHDPSTWPAQSQMAADGQWDDLRKWQDELNKGKV